MDFLVDQMEQVLVVRLQDLLLQTAGAVHRPAVQRQHPFRWQTMLRGIEAVEIGQQESSGIAHAPVGIGHALEDFVGDIHLAAIVGCRRPQPQHVGAQRIDHFCGATTLPSDFDILRPWASTVKPWVSNPL